MNRISSRLATGRHTATLLRIGLGVSLSLSLLVGCAGTGGDGDGFRARFQADPDEDGGAAPDSAAFSLDRAVEMGRLTLYSYQQLTDFLTGDTFDLPEGYTLENEYITYEWFSGDSTSIGDDPTPIVFVATKGDEIFVLYRGSVTPSEWLDDVTFAQFAFTEVDNGGFTHEGFTDVFRSVREELLADLDELIAARTNPQIFIGGHSLGGSLSVLGAIDIAEHTGVAPQLYTFAGPRVGDLAFQAAYRERVPTSFRIININDFVPKYPPKTVAVTRGETREIKEYRHVNVQHPLEFGSWVEPPVIDGLDGDLSTPVDLGGLDLSGLDGNLDTAVDIDFENVDWDSPTLIANHGICNYYNFLCDETDDPEGCKLAADGQDDCNADLL